jgi:NAD(P)-dependent dehydrogenase (short-subunit alcohol dehydrogenase family)
VERLGGIDALVINAGISRPGNAVDQTAEGWDEVLRTNLTGAFLTAHFALPYLEQRRGCVVTVGSVAGLRASTDSVAYCTSKAGLAMLTRCLAIDHGPRGVRANCVAPGWVRTPMADRSMDGLARSHTMTRDDAYALAARNIPTRRPASVVEVADLVAWLCGPEAGSVNGAVIPVDGGAHTVDVASLEFAP